LASNTNAWNVVVGANYIGRKESPLPRGGNNYDVLVLGGSYPTTAADQTTVPVPMKAYLPY